MEIFKFIIQVLKLGLIQVLLVYYNYKMGKLVLYKMEQRAVFQAFW